MGEEGKEEEKEITEERRGEKRKGQGKDISFQETPLVTHFHQVGASPIVCNISQLGHQLGTKPSTHQPVGAFHIQIKAASNILVNEDIS
jgi:hypothetical protein